MSARFGAVCRDTRSVRQGHFCRELLPSARSFYQSEFAGHLGRESRGWCKVLCPFHPDHHPSLSVNVRNGAFRCFSCGAHGGDILDFVKLRHGYDFRQAAVMLGAWQGNRICKKERAVLTQQRCRRARLQRAAEHLVCAERDLRLQYRTEIHDLEYSKRYLSERLSVLRQDPVEAMGQDAENCWETMALLLDELRSAVAAYWILAFAAAEERARFVLFAEERDAMAAAALERGYVIDDQDFRMEIPSE